MTTPRASPRVLVVSHEASRTGAPRVAADVLRALRADGATPVVWHRWGGPLRAELDDLAARSVTQPLNRLRVLARRRRVTRPLARAIDRWATERVLTAVEPDLVWCNTVVTAPVAVAAARRGLPVVLHSHEQAAWLAGARRSLADLDLDRVTLVGCSSDAAELLAEATGSGSAEPTEVLHTSVDVADVVVRAARVARPDPGPGRTVVGCGTGDHRKGFDVFVDAARRSAAGGRSVTWRWVGAVPPGTDAGPVELAGEVPDAVVEIGAADVVVLPSRADSFPVVVLEAMAAGRPVVASALPGPAEQLGGTGVLVPVADAAALADAVHELLDDPDRAARLGAAAAARCRETWDRSVFDRRAAEIARTALGRHAGPDAAARPVRVVHLLHRLSRSGGVQMVVRRLAEAVDPAAIDLHVVTVRPRSPADAIEGLPVVVHPLGRAGHLRLWDRVRLVVGAARAVRRLRPDVVQLHSGTAWLGIGARIVAPRSGFVLEVHDAPGSGRHGRSTDRMEGWMVRRFAMIAVCHSSSVADEVRARWRVPPERLTVFPLGVDVDRLAPRGPADRARVRTGDGIPIGLPVAIGIGRFAPSKCFHEAVEAIERCRSAGTDAGLVLVGYGSEEGRIRSTVERLGLQDRVWLVGARVGDELAETLAAADVLISPSIYEGFGLTVVEAMACGLPVVARAVGGVTDLVEDGVTGRLVRGRSVEALGDALHDVLGHPERGLDWGSAGRRRAVEHFSTEATARSFTDLYRRCGARGHSAR